MSKRQHVSIALGLVASLTATSGATPARAQEAAENVAAAPESPPSYTQQFGFSARARYVTVPSWFLGLFTEANSPLHSSGFLLEGFRRKDDFDIAIGLGYQNMSPPDGNWLGRGKTAAVDTDFVQVQNMRLISLEVSFVRNTWINEYFGFYYGAGLGLGILTGKILRTSAGNCTDDNVGDTSQCKPIVCSGSQCTEQELERSEGGKDNGPASPRRFAEPDKPGALPILNLMAGLSLRLPEVPGLELRLLEGGFHNAFFLGSSVAYLF